MQRDSDLFPSATAIAYPISSPINQKEDMEDNVYSSHLGDSNFADDTIEMSGNFFSQLDSMIAAVKVESSALDSMKEKLKEVDALRNQISTFTKRLLDADQANLNLKTNLVKVQEAYADMKKAKADAESSMVPLHQELNRAKEAFSKERMARLSAQQETAMLKDQLARLQKTSDDAQRECKAIPGLVESNEMLKAELAALRRRYKEEKTAAARQIRAMEAQARDVEAVKGEVRGLAMRLMDVSSSAGPHGSQPNQGNTGTSGSHSNFVAAYLQQGGGGTGNSFSSNIHSVGASYQQQQPHVRYGGGSSVSSTGGGGGNVQYEYGFEQGEGDGEDEEDDGENSYGQDLFSVEGAAGGGVNEEEDEEVSFDSSLAGDLADGSVHSAASQQQVYSIRQYMPQLQQKEQQQQVQMQSQQYRRHKGAGKKKSKRAVQQQQQGPPKHQFQQQTSGNQSSLPRGGDGAPNSFSLPRIHS